MPVAGMSEQPPLALLALLRGLGSLVGISRGSAAGTLAATVQGDGVTVVDANSQVSCFCRSIAVHAYLVDAGRRPVAEALHNTYESQTAGAAQLPPLLICMSAYYGCL